MSKCKRCEVLEADRHIIMMEREAALNASSANARRASQAEHDCDVLTAKIAVLRAALERLVKFATAVPAPQGASWGTPVHDARTLLAQSSPQAECLLMVMKVAEELERITRESSLPDDPDGRTWSLASEKVADTLFEAVAALAKVRR